MPDGTVEGTDSRETVPANAGETETVGTEIKAPEGGEPEGGGDSPPVATDPNWTAEAWNDYQEKISYVGKLGNELGDTRAKLQRYEDQGRQMFGFGPPGATSERQIAQFQIDAIKQSTAIAEQAKQRARTLGYTDPADIEAFATAAVLRNVFSAHSVLDQATDMVERKSIKAAIKEELSKKDPVLAGMKLDAKAAEELMLRSPAYDAWAALARTAERTLGDGQAPPGGLPGGRKSAERQADTGQLTDEERRVASRYGVSEKSYAKHRSRGERR